MYYTVETYKGYGIDRSPIGFIVHYCGDDVVFTSIESARQFIDEIA